MPRNPFRTEAEAFRFVLLTIVYGAVFVVETAVVAWWIFTRGRRERPVPQAPPPHPAGERRILVVANETVAGTELIDEVCRRCRSGEKVLVVSPALNSPLKH